MKKEYDFSNGVRGKYAKAYKDGDTIIKLVKKMGICCRVGLLSHHVAKYG